MEGWFQSSTLHSKRPHSSRTAMRASSIIIAFPIPRPRSSGRTKRSSRYRPGLPSQVEKVKNHSANPATWPSSSARSTENRGDGPNPCRRKSSSVATTATEEDFLRHGFGPSPREVLLGRGHRVRSALVLGQVPHQAQDDGHVILRLVRDLAEYERAPDAVAATEEDFPRRRPEPMPQEVLLGRGGRDRGGLPAAWVRAVAAVLCASRRGRRP